ncbi:hypothetical protein [Streptomyces sp. NPDC001970]
MNLPVLYARSRALPVTLAVLAATALAAAWCAWRLQAAEGYDHTARVPVVVLAPLLAASAVGTGLFTHSDELDRTAVRPWWARRVCLVVGPTVLAGLLLALSVPGHPDQFGAPAMVRNLLGAAGVTAAAAVLLGARLSWLPMTAYLSTVYVSAPQVPGGAAAVWAWPMQPGPQGAAWAVALTTYAAGVALYAWRGARPEQA